MSDVPKAVLEQIQHFLRANLAESCHFQPLDLDSFRSSLIQNVPMLDTR